MNALKNKIRSRTGASITFALLLFLVCAVVSAVVIVASSTASGRMSKIPEIDQRYYAVNSAAEWLGYGLDGQSVSVVQTGVETTVTRYDAHGESVGSPTKTESDPITEVYLGSDPSDPAVTELDEEAEINQYLLPGVAYTVISSENDSTVRFPINTAMTLETAGGVTLPESCTVDSSAALGMLNVSIRQLLDRDGTVTFYLTKDVKNAENVKTGEYTLRLTFEAERTENTVEKTERGAPVLTGTDGAYTVTDEKTTTTTTVFTWHLIGMTKATLPT